MTDWLNEWRRLRDAGEPAVLVTVAGTRGSAPREVGATMLVTAREAAGTIGGGELEYQCTHIAARLLGSAPQEHGFLRRFPLGPNCGQCCGGVVDVLFERLDGAGNWLEPLLRVWHERIATMLVTTLDDAGRPSRALVTADEVMPADANAGDLDAVRRALARGARAERVDTPGRGQPFLLIESVTDGGFDVVVFGAGHVGSAIVRAMAALDCRLRWVDSRRHIFPDALPTNVQAIEAAQPEREVAAMPPGAYCLVMTHSHALDLEICARVLARGDQAYCGLIGSVSKRRRFERRLKQRGLTEADLRRLICPIGIGGISGKRPAEIAIAVSADILRRRERHDAAACDRGASVHAIHKQ